MIEEEREEDERKLSAAIAATDRMNVLVREGEKTTYKTGMSKGLHSKIPLTC